MCVGYTNPYAPSDGGNWKARQMRTDQLGYKDALNQWAAGGSVGPKPVNPVLGAIGKGLMAGQAMPTVFKNAGGMNLATGYGASGSGGGPTGGGMRTPTAPRAGTAIPGKTR